MKVSCSSEGDEVQFILSLDGHLLMQTRTHNQSQRNWKGDTQSLTTDKHDRANVSNVSISLYGQLTGNLTCRVWNNFSRDEKVIHLKSCKDCVSCFPVVTVAVIASVALLLHVALCVGLKHLKKKPTQITVHEASITDWLFVIVIASVSTPLLLLALFFGIKHLQKKTRLMTVTEGNAEDEIIYSDVVVKNRRHNRRNLDQSAT
ncbi:uncharacterized protein LOC122995085 isoform X2 [Scomber scombrus]|uniref:Uncharacterized protein LOC122995085 isoform X2 n=1 Tax=Scomber scombrus TaxID=13677 RepID=A0AAV1QDR3_SCOSC